MKVTIITPYYNGEKYMDGYIDCMLANKKKLEEHGDCMDVILVNDSPDKKLEVGEGAKSFIKVLTNDENSGIHQSRVNGLVATDADYVMFLDQDDLIEDDAIALMISLVKENDSRADVIVANARLEQSDGTSLVWYRTPYHKSVIGDYETYLNVGTQIISPGQCLIKRDSIPDFWVKNIQKINGSDDYYLWLLMLAKGCRFEYFDKPLYKHVYTAKNLSADTTVTDDSIYEFLEMLSGCDYVEQKDIFKVHDMITYKAQFRASGKVGKITSSLANLGICITNIIYKRKTDTKLGFNR